MNAATLEHSDPEVFRIIEREETRQQNNLSLIPSENFFSAAVREAVGSVMMHKYAEGNIGRRYYEGNENVDQLEALAIERAKQVFKLPPGWDVNVQALSGSSANLAVYLALLNFGDSVMSMYLPDGGHLSHGWSFEPDGAQRERQSRAGQLIYLGGSRKVNIVSKMFKVTQYKTDPKTKRFNYEAIEQMAQHYKPRMIITGGTAYPRDIDYGRVREIADSMGALYLADIAHEAGLIAAGVLPSPVGVADVVTMTTHKTLRSGRGAIILASAENIKKINRAIMPGLQGGPHNHNIAGIAVGLGEAQRREFRSWARQVVGNAKSLSAALVKEDFDVVSGGTDKHLVLLDLTKERLLGKKFARALAIAGLVANANSVPQETRGPADPSGLRLGTPWVTTRGLKVSEMKVIAGWLRQVMTIAGKWKENEFTDFNERALASAELMAMAQEVKILCDRYPLALGEKAAIMAA